MKKFLKLLLICLLSLPLPVYAFGEQLTREALAFLPSYCRGTQGIRGVSGDTTPISTYVRLYGIGYYHLHHYCWALYEERMAMQAPFHSEEGEITESGWLERALDNIEYSLKRAKDTFFLKPEMLVTHARVLNDLGRTNEAVDSLKKAIRIKQGYLPAYIRLSDLYKNMGNRALVISTLQDGLRAVPGTALIMERLRSMGVTPDPRYTSPVDKHAGVAAPGSAEALSGGESRNTEQAAAGSGEKPKEHRHSATVQDGARPRDNPYCRFCAD